MTTTIVVQSHNYPVLVEVKTYIADGVTGNRDGDIAQLILWPEDGPVTFYTTTTYGFSAIDLGHGDPRAVADRAKRFPGVAVEEPTKTALTRDDIAAADPSAINLSGGGHYA